MIEFGAGGQITQSTEPEPTTGAEGEAATPGETAAAGNPGETGEGAEAANATTAATPAAAPATPPTTTVPRRKRKAKGWFCPVCRQRMILFFLG